MNINIKKINAIKEYTGKETNTLFLTSKRDVADFLTGKGEAVCIDLIDESDISSFDCYKYFITGGVQDIGHLNMVYCHIMNLPYVIGETKRIAVREETPDDLSEIYAIYEDEECRKYLEPLPHIDTDADESGLKDSAAAGDNPASSDRIETGVTDSPCLNKFSRYKSVKDSYMLLGYGMWIIEEKASGKVIGRAGFEYVDDNTVSLGFVIRKNERKKGYAYEACLLCLNFLFDSNPDLSVIAKYSFENKASKALLCKLQKSSPISIKLMEES